MQRIHDKMKYESVKFEVPESVKRKEICKETGLLASSEACTKYTEYFAEGTGPSKTCPGHAGAPTEGTTDGATNGSTTGGNSNNGGNSNSGNSNNNTTP